MKVAEKGVLTSRVVPEAPVFAKDGHLQQGGGCQNNSCSASVYKDKHTKPLSGLNAHHALFFFFFFALTSYTCVFRNKMPSHGRHQKR